VPRLTFTRKLDAAGLAALRQPRDDIVGERADGEDRFVQADGPFITYERRIEVLDTNGVDGTEHTVQQTIEFQLPRGTWRFVVHRAVARTLRKPPAKSGKMPWWAPSQRPDARAATILGLLAALSLTLGYLATLIGRTMTFAADEFGVGKTAQSVALSSVRVGAALAIGLTALADRRGRKLILVASMLTSIGTTALGALTPNLAGLVASQAVARGAMAAAVVMLGIIVAEEMPAGARAYAVSLLAMTTALGAGMALWILPVADIGLRAWRILYVVPLLMIPAVLHFTRLLPETRRFERPHPTVSLRSALSRLWVLAAVMFLYNIFNGSIPQFQNDFLRDERHFSAGAISLFVTVTSTPAGLGIIVGGRLAETIGRRAVAAWSVTVSTALIGASFAVSGPPMWILATAGAVIAGAIVPSVLVYWPELFPTSLRGRSNGIVSAAASAGSVVGLLAIGVLADKFGSFAATMPVVAIGPILMVVLILKRFPESAHRELEDLNPVDRMTTGDNPTIPAPRSTHNPG
jgi:MFS family permease